METRGDWKLAPLGWEALGLALKAFFLAIGEARMASLERVVSQGETIILALSLKVSLALLHRALPLSEAEIASLLALCGASFLTSQLRSLALSALVLASRLRTFLALSVVSGSDTNAINTQRCFSLNLAW